LLNYNFKVKEFYDHFDKFTLDDYERKFNEKKIKNIININDIKKTRELKFFICLIEHLKKINNLTK
jgi:hypothetical protein